VIAYLDSSAVVRSYLTDEARGASPSDLIRDPDITTVTGSWSRIEATSAFVRAERTGRFVFADLEAAFLRDTDPVGGTLLIVDASQAEIELIALRVVREYGLRAMDAWQLACAHLTFEALADPHEQTAFVTRDAEQARVAQEWGYLLI
jgi:uncharacterized protein